jgi:hypothetical protein
LYFLNYFFNKLIIKINKFKQQNKMALPFRQDQSPIQAYLRDNLRERIVCDKQELMKFFSPENQNALMGKIRELTFQRLQVKIPPQPRIALEKIQVDVFDFFPKGDTEAWNKMVITESLSKIRMNAQLSSVHLTKQLRGRNPLPARLPREEELIRGDQSLDLTAGIIKRGLAGRPRRSRREGLINFLTNSSSDFTFAKNIGDRSCESENRIS